MSPVPATGQSNAAIPTAAPVAFLQPKLRRIQPKKNSADQTIQRHDPMINQRWRQEEESVTAQSLHGEHEDRMDRLHADTAATKKRSTALINTHEASACMPRA